MKKSVQYFLYYSLKFSQFAFVLLAIATITLYFLKDRYPEKKIIDNRLYEEPIQTKVDMPEFHESSGGSKYTIKPLYKYEISGVVVTQHNSKSWLDHYHEATGDFINLKDLCLVWGENIETDIYKKVKYRSGDFTCFFKYKGRDAYENFQPNQLSNNHLLTTNPQIQETLKKVKKGDQVRLKGYLSKYTNENGGERGTSTTRTDHGNGACETIYLTQAEIIKPSYPHFDTLFQISRIATFATLALTITLIIVMPYGKPN